MTKKLTLALLLFVCSGLSLYGQGLIMPWLPQSFTNAAGVPLANGRLYQCAQGSPCPGSPRATYNSSSLSTPNANPMILNSAGVATNDGTTVSGVWLTPNLGYSFVWTDSTGAVVGSIDNIFGAITSTGGGSVTPCGAAGQIQYYGSSTTLGCSPNLTWTSAGNVLGVIGTSGQAAIAAYSGYVQSYGGYLSTVPGGGSWNAFQSPTDGSFMRGYAVQQTTANTAGGYIDLSPVTYNPYNGTQCLDTFGNVVQQPVALNGLTGFGPNDALLWVGTSPSMPSGGSCGAPLPISPSQTYGGVANQRFGLFTNSYFFARGGVATDAAFYNSFQSLNGGIYTKLGMTTDQAVYPKGYAASTSLNTPAAGYGGLAYQNGSVYYYYNATSGTWNTVNFASSGGGGSAQGPANAVQTNDPAGAGAFTGYSWLTVNPGGSFGGYLVSQGGYQVTASGSGGCNVFNCVDVLSGGVHTGLGVTVDQALYPKAFATTGSLNSPASGYGGFSYAGASVGTGATYRYYNAMSAAWATVDFSTSGSGCTLGGTATGQIIFNLSSACTSSGNLTWNNSSQQMGITSTANSVAALTIATGYGLATGGWNAGTCTASTCIQAPNGGLSAGLGVTAGQGFYSFNFAPVGGAAPGSLNPPAAGYGGLAYAGSGLYWAWNGAAWYSWTPGSGGGGGACPGGAANTIQYNNGSSACSGSGNLTFNSGTNVMNLSGSFTLAGSPSINSSNQFVGAGVAVTGAISGTSITGSSTIQSTLGSGVAFQAGAGAFQAFANGNINGLNINASTAFQIGGTAMINSSGQFVGFGGVNTAGAITSASSINSTISTAAVAFQAGGGNFQALGNGNVNGLNINARTSLQINGTVMINNLGQFISAGGINTNGVSTFGSAVNFNGGIATGPATSSTFYTGVGGNLYIRPITGIGSCSSIADGWFAINTVNKQLYVCVGGVEYHTVALTTP